MKKKRLNQKALERLALLHSQHILGMTKISFRNNLVQIKLILE